MKITDWRLMLFMLLHSYMIMQCLNAWWVKSKTDYRFYPGFNCLEDNFDLNTKMVSKTAGFCSISYYMKASLTVSLSNSLLSCCQCISLNINLCTIMVTCCILDHTMKVLYRRKGKRVLKIQLQMWWKLKYEHSMDKCTLLSFEVS